MNTESSANMGGTLGLSVIRAGEQIPDIPGGIPFSNWPTAERIRDILQHALPQRGLSDEVNRWRLANQRHFQRGFRKVGLAKALRIPTLYGALWLDVIRADGSHVPLGLASLRVVTDAGVAIVADCFVSAAANPNVEDFDFHGIGTGGTAENATDTDLVTELTTQYSTDNTRATGTPTNPTAPVYRSVATNSVDASAAIVEHGVLTSATVGSGTLLDRTVFSAVNLSNGDSLQTTYDLTISSGS